MFCLIKVFQTCKYNATGVGSTISAVSPILPSGNEDALIRAIAQIGPISASIDASDPSFRFYSSGIYNSKACNASNLNHAVTLVGYGSIGNLSYYIAKNSWGSNWGQNGFFQIARKWPNNSNMCGIASMCIYPIP